MNGSSRWTGPIVSGRSIQCPDYDYVATGPNGQRTIDEVILSALKKREDIAQWTTDAWRVALTKD